MFQNPLMVKKIATKDMSNLMFLNLLMVKKIATKEYVELNVS